MHPVEEAPRGVLDLRSGRGRFDVTRTRPGPALAELVEHFWTVSWDLRGRDPHTQHTLPHPSVHLVAERDRSGVMGALTGRFTLDSLWDRPTHPEGWYFRSDHVPYAERNVPALFFSTNLHSDYHTPRDEPKNIDYAKLTRVTQWMYMTGWIAANAAKRPAIDAGFVLR